MDENTNEVREFFAGREPQPYREFKGSSLYRAAVDSKDIPRQQALTRQWGQYAEDYATRSGAFGEDPVEVSAKTDALRNWTHNTAATIQNVEDVREAQERESNKGWLGILADSAKAGGTDWLNSKNQKALDKNAPDELDKLSGLTAGLRLLDDLGTLSPEELEYFKSRVKPVGWLEVHPDKKSFGKTALRIMGFEGSIPHRETDIYTAAEEGDRRAQEDYLSAWGPGSETQEGRADLAKKPKTPLFPVEGSELGRTARLDYLNDLASRMGKEGVPLAVEMLSEGRLTPEATRALLEEEKVKVAGQFKEFLATEKGKKFRKAATDITTVESYQRDLAPNVALDEYYAATHREEVDPITGETKTVSVNNPLAHVAALAENGRFFRMLPQLFVRNLVANAEPLGEIALMGPTSRFGRFLGRTAVGGERLVGTAGGTMSALRRMETLGSAGAQLEKLRELDRTSRTIKLVDAAGAEAKVVGGALEKAGVSTAAAAERLVGTRLGVEAADEAAKIAAGKVTASTLAIGLQAYGQSATEAYLGALRDAGVDTSNPASIMLAYMEQPEAIEEARGNAWKRGLAVAGFEMAGSFFVFKGTAAQTSQVKQLAHTFGTAPAVSGALGGAGELAGQVASGQDVDLADVIIELASELGQAIPEGLMYHGTEAVRGVKEKTVAAVETVAPQPEQGPQVEGVEEDVALDIEGVDPDAVGEEGTVGDAAPLDADDPALADLPENVRRALATKKVAQGASPVAGAAAAPTPTPAADRRSPLFDDPAVSPHAKSVANWAIRFQKDQDATLEEYAVTLEKRGSLREVASPTAILPGRDRAVTFGTMYEADFTTPEGVKGTRTYHSRRQAAVEHYHMALSQIDALGLTGQVRNLVQSVQPPEVAAQEVPASPVPVEEAPTPAPATPPSGVEVLPQGEAQSDFNLLTPGMTLERPGDPTPFKVGGVRTVLENGQPVREVEILPDNAGVPQVRAADDDQFFAARSTLNREQYQADKKALVDLEAQRAQLETAVEVSPQDVVEDAPTEEELQARLAELDEEMLSDLDEDERAQKIQEHREVRDKAHALRMGTTDALPAKAAPAAEQVAELDARLDAARERVAQVDAARQEWATTLTGPEEVALANPVWVRQDQFDAGWTPGKDTVARMGLAKKQRAQGEAGAVTDLGKEGGLKVTTTGGTFTVPFYSRSAFLNHINLTPPKARVGGLIAGDTGPQEALAELEAAFEHVMTQKPTTSKGYERFARHMEVIVRAGRKGLDIVNSPLRDRMLEFSAARPVEMKDAAFDALVAQSVYWRQEAQARKSAIDAGTVVVKPRVEDGPQVALAEGQDGVPVSSLPKASIVTIVAVNDGNKVPEGVGVGTRLALTEDWDAVEGADLPVLKVAFQDSEGHGRVFELDPSGVELSMNMGLNKQRAADMEAAPTVEPTPDAAPKRTTAKKKSGKYKHPGTVVTVRRLPLTVASLQNEFENYLMSPSLGAATEEELEVLSKSLEKTPEVVAALVDAVPAYRARQEAAPGLEPHRVLMGIVRRTQEGMVGSGSVSEFATSREFRASVLRIDPEAAFPQAVAAKSREATQAAVVEVRRDTPRAYAEKLLASERKNLDPTGVKGSRATLHVYGNDVDGLQFHPLRGLPTGMRIPVQGAGGVAFNDAAPAEEVANNFRAIRYDVESIQSRIYTLMNPGGGRVPIFPVLSFPRLMMGLHGDNGMRRASPRHFAFLQREMVDKLGVFVHVVEGDPHVVQVVKSGSKVGIDQSTQDGGALISEMMEVATRFLKKNSPELKRAELEVAAREAVTLRLEESGMEFVRWAGGVQRDLTPPPQEDPDAMVGDSPVKALRPAKAEDRVELEKLVPTQASFEVPASPEAFGVVSGAENLFAAENVGPVPAPKETARVADVESLFTAGQEDEAAAQKAADDELLKSGLIPKHLVPLYRSLWRSEAKIDPAAPSPALKAAVTRAKRKLGKALEEEFKNTKARLAFGRKVTKGRNSRGPAPAPTVAKDAPPMDVTEDLDAPPVDEFEDASAAPNNPEADFLAGVTFTPDEDLDGPILQGTPSKAKPGVKMTMDLGRQEGAKLAALWFQSVGTLLAQGKEPGMLADLLQSEKWVRAATGGIYGDIPAPVLQMLRTTARTEALGIYHSKGNPEVNAWVEKISRDRAEAKAERKAEDKADTEPVAKDEKPGVKTPPEWHAPGVKEGGWWLQKESSDGRYLPPLRPKGKGATITPYTPRIFTSRSAALTAAEAMGLARKNSSGEFEYVNIDPTVPLPAKVKERILTGTRVNPRGSGKRGVHEFRLLVPYGWKGPLPIGQRFDAKSAATVQQLTRFWEASAESGSYPTTMVILAHWDEATGGAAVPSNQKVLARAASVELATKASEFFPLLPVPQGAFEGRSKAYSDKNHPGHTYYKYKTAEGKVEGVFTNDPYQIASMLDAGVTEVYVPATMAADKVNRAIEWDWKGGTRKVVSVSVKEVGARDGTATVSGPGDLQKARKHGRDAQSLRQVKDTMWPAEGRPEYVMETLHSWSRLAAKPVSGDTSARVLNPRDVQDLMVAYDARVRDLLRNPANGIKGVPDDKMHEMAMNILARRIRQIQVGQRFLDMTEKARADDVPARELAEIFGVTYGAGTAEALRARAYSFMVRAKAGIPARNEAGKFVAAGSGLMSPGTLLEYTINKMDKHLKQGGRYEILRNIQDIDAPVSDGEGGDAGTLHDVLGDSGPSPSEQAERNEASAKRATFRGILASLPEGDREIASRWWRDLSMSEQAEVLASGESYATRIAKNFIDQDRKTVSMDAYMAENFPDIQSGNYDDVAGDFDPEDGAPSTAVKYFGEEGYTTSTVGELEALGIRVQAEGQSQVRVVVADTSSGGLLDVSATTLHKNEVVTALRNIMALGGSQGALAEVLLSRPHLFRGTDFMFTSHPELAGMFVRGTEGDNDMVMLGDRSNGRGAADALLHELVHKATFQAIENPGSNQERAAVSGLKAVLKQATDAWAASEGDRKDFYHELSSLHEMVAAAFTNPEFQEFLDGIQIREGMGRKLVTLLREFVRHVASLLTGGRVRQGSALHVAFEEAVVLMEGARYRDMAAASPVVETGIVGQSPGSPAIRRGFAPADTSRGVSAQKQRADAVADVARGIYDSHVDRNEVDAILLMSEEKFQDFLDREPSREFAAKMEDLRGLVPVLDVATVDSMTAPGVGALLSSAAEYSRSGDDISAQLNAAVNYIAAHKALTGEWLHSQQVPELMLQDVFESIEGLPETLMQMHLTTEMFSDSEMVPLGAGAESVVFVTRDGARVVKFPMPYKGTYVSVALLEDNSIGFKEGKVTGVVDSAVLGRIPGMVEHDVEGVLPWGGTVTSQRMLKGGYAEDGVTPHDLWREHHGFSTLSVSHDLARRSVVGGLVSWVGSMPGTPTFVGDGRGNYFIAADLRRSNVKEADSLTWRVGAATFPKDTIPQVFDPLYLKLTEEAIASSEELVAAKEKFDARAARGPENLVPRGTPSLAQSVEGRRFAERLDAHTSASRAAQRMLDAKNDMREVAAELAPGSVDTLLAAAARGIPGAAQTDRELAAWNHPKFKRARAVYLKALDEAHLGGPGRFRGKPGDVTTFSRSLLKELEAGVPSGNAGVYINPKHTFSEALHQATDAAATAANEDGAHGTATIELVTLNPATAKIFNAQATDETRVGTVPDSSEYPVFLVATPDDAEFDYEVVDGNHRFASSRAEGKPLIAVVYDPRRSGDKSSPPTTAFKGFPAEAFTSSKYDRMVRGIEGQTRPGDRGRAADMTTFSRSVDTGRGRVSAKIKKTGSVGDYSYTLLVNGSQTVFASDDPSKALALSNKVLDLSERLASGEIKTGESGFLSLDGEDLTVFKGGINTSRPIDVSFFTPDEITAHAYATSAGEILGRGAVDPNESALAAANSEAKTKLLSLDDDGKLQAAYRIIWGTTNRYSRANYDSFSSDPEAVANAKFYQGKEKVTRFLEGKFDEVIREAESPFLYEYAGMPMERALAAQQGVVSAKVKTGKIKFIEEETTLAQIDKAKAEGYDSLIRMGAVGGRLFPEIVVFDSSNIVVQGHSPARPVDSFVDAMVGVPGGRGRAADMGTTPEGKLAASAALDDVRPAELEAVASKHPTKVDAPFSPYTFSHPVVASAAVAGSPDSYTQAERDMARSHLAPYRLGSPALWDNLGGDQTPFGEVDVRAEVAAIAPGIAVGVGSEGDGMLWVRGDSIFYNPEVLSEEMETIENPVHQRGYLRRLIEHEVAHVATKQAFSRVELVALGRDISESARRELVNRAKLGIAPEDTSEEALYEIGAEFARSAWERAVHGNTTEEEFMRLSTEGKGVLATVRRFLQSLARYLRRRAKFLGSPALGMSVVRLERMVDALGRGYVPQDLGPDTHPDMPLFARGTLRWFADEQKHFRKGALAKVDRATRYFGGWTRELYDHVEAGDSRVAARHKKMGLWHDKITKALKKEYGRNWSDDATLTQLLSDAIGTTSSLTEQDISDLNNFSRSASQQIAGWARSARETAKRLRKLPNGDAMAKQLLDSIAPNVAVRTKAASAALAQMKKAKKDAMRRDALALSRAALNALKPETAALANEVRVLIDNSSETLAVALDNRTDRYGRNISERQAQVVRANLGIYLHRSYAIFSSPRYSEWLQKGMDESGNIIRGTEQGEMIHNVEGLVRRRLLDIETRRIMRAPNRGGTTMTPAAARAAASANVTDDKVRQELEMLVLAGNSGAGLGAKNNVSTSLDSQILAERGVVPPELRALWGEYQDPLQLAVQSVEAVEGYLTNLEMMQGIYDTGKAQGLVSDTQKGGFVQLRKSGNVSKYGPLADVYVHNHLSNVIHKTSPSPGVLTRWALKLTGLALMAKTVLSIPTIARNFFGNIMIGVANGHVLNTGVLRPDKALTRSLQSGRSAFFGFNRWSSKMWGLLGDGAVKSRRAAMEQAEADLLEATALGFIDSSEVILAQDLLNMKGVTSEDVARETNPVLKGWLWGSRAAQNTMSTLSAIYGSFDNFWKINGFKQELDRIMRRDHLSAPTEAAKKEAADIIKEVYPNYNRNPELIQALKRNAYTGTLLAPFITFTWQIWRSTLASFRLGVKEMKSGQTSQGAWRMARTFGTTMLLTNGLTLAARAMFGFDDEDDEMIRRNLPDYQKDGIILPTAVEDGKFSFIDVTYFDPYDSVSGPFWAALREFRDTGEVLPSAEKMFTQLAEPYMRRQILVRKMVEAAYNRDEYGRPIYLEDDTESAKKSEMARHVGGAFMPGTVDWYERIVKGQKGALPDTVSTTLFDETVLRALGIKRQTIDTRPKMLSAARGFTSRQGEASAYLSSALGTLGRMDPEEAGDAYRKANDANRRVFEDVSRQVFAARKLGLSRSEVISALRGSSGKGEKGISEQDANDILNGVYRRLEVSDFVMNKARHKARSAKGGKDGRLSGLDQAIRATPKVERIPLE